MQRAHTVKKLNKQSNPLKIVLNKKKQKKKNLKTILQDYLKSKI